MNEQFSNRLVANKVRIANLVNAEYIKAAGEFEPNYVLIRDKKVSRVNLIATVISKYVSEDQQYIALVLDDGSDSIQTKSWKEDTKILKDIEIGDLVLVIAKIRNYNDQNYLSPEIVKRLESLMWLELRRKELNKIYGPLIPQESQPIKQVFIQSQEKNVSSTQNERRKIVELIEKFNKENGADISDVIKNSEMPEEKTNKIIQELLKDGEIFEIRPGGLKVIY